MDSIQLTYPTTQQGQKFMMDNKPSAVKQWLSNLTFSDVNKSLEQLLQAIKTSNRTEYKLAHREENLATLEKGYLRLSHHFREHNDERQIIPTDSQLKLLSALTSEMAYGYKRVVHELTEQRMLLNKSSRLAKAINQAQHFLGLHLIEHYQQYSPVPSYIWHELHKLYYFAEQEKLHTVKFKTSNDSLSALNTIENTYKRNCLMSVINPYHVEDNQHWHLFKYFSLWGHKALISADLKKYSKSECFVIDLTSSQRPEYAESDNEYEEHNLYRLLITSKLLDELDKHLYLYEEKKALPKDSFYSAIDKSVAFKLLQQIYAYCDHHIERKDARYPVISNVSLVFGLGNVVKVLHDDNHIDTSEQLDIAIKELLGRDYHHQTRWQAVNYSNGGICVRQPKEDVTQLKIGSLILLKRNINNKPQKSWQLGIVRWLSGKRNTGATMGVEYIHGQKIPARYLTKNKEGELIKHKVLLVSPFSNQETLMIAPRNLLGDNKTIALEYNNAVIDHQVLHTEESNSLISIFTISRNDID
ncbi:MAG: hypothetical protein CMP47_14925 [Rickettsiales bacterium]|nr:hypothetical protein [Rickettsiales bacterium]